MQINKVILAKTINLWKVIINLYSIPDKRFYDFWLSLSEAGLFPKFYFSRKRLALENRPLLFKSFLFYTSFTKKFGTKQKSQFVFASFIKLFWAPFLAIRSNSALAHCFSSPSLHQTSTNSPAFPPLAGFPLLSRARLHKIIFGHKSIGVRL